MLSQSRFRHEELPYEPLPEAASHAVFASLFRFGFDHDAIEEKYSFSSRKNLVRVNALAFAHPSQRDLDDYASITVFNAVDGHNDKALVSLLAESSAPFHLIHREDKFSFWASGVDTQKNKTNVQPIKIETSIAYERLGDVLDAYAVDLKPQRIIDVKQGRDVFKRFPQVNPLQLSLWAEEIRSKPLVKCFEHAVSILRDHPAQLSSDTITTIATQLLGVLILADTGALGQEIRLNRPPLPELLSRARTIFHHYFDAPLLLKMYPDAVNRAYDILQIIHYAGFVPDMLGDLYAVAYEQKVRRQLGNYDTPEGVS